VARVSGAAGNVVAYAPLTAHIKQAVNVARALWQQTTLTTGIKRLSHSALCSYARMSMMTKRRGTAVNAQLMCAQHSAAQNASR